MQVAEGVRYLVIFAVVLGAAGGAAWAEETGGDIVCVSDAWQELAPEHTQAWGSLGLNTATKPPDGRSASPLKVGDQVYEKGLGAHAGGATTIALRSDFVRFEAEVGIQRQSGGRGSVVFEVYVDDEKRASVGPLNDDAAPQPIAVDVEGGRVLRLVSHDNGDGIGCDMANWLNARFVYDPNRPRTGEPSVTLMGQPAPEPSAPVCGFTLLAAEGGPQLVRLETMPGVCLGREKKRTGPLLHVLKASVQASVRWRARERVSLSAREQHRRA